jgi:hypothetical protein
MSAASEFMIADSFIIIIFCSHHADDGIDVEKEKPVDAAIDFVQILQQEHVRVLHLRRCIRECGL